MSQFEKALAGIGKTELEAIAGELLREIQGAETAERGYDGFFAEEIIPGLSRRFVRRAVAPIHKSTEGGDGTIEPYKKAVGAEYVHDTHEKAADTHTDIASKGNFTGYAAREAMAEGHGMDLRAQAQRLSDFFRRDSRRYDSGFRRY